MVKMKALKCVFSIGANFTQSLTRRQTEVSAVCNGIVELAAGGQLRPLEGIIESC